MAAGMPAVWAHRGARRAAPENTLEAFSLALRMGADGVELDVRRSADGTLVVHHDGTARGIGPVAEMSGARIRELRPDIPTLREALDCCAGALVNIEIKNAPSDEGFDPSERVAEDVVTLLAERGGDDDVLVSAFQLATIDRVRALDPDVRTALLLRGRVEHVSARARRRDLDAAIRHCSVRGHGAVHPFVVSLASRDAREGIARAHEQNLAVNAWTVNSERQIARLAAAGIDAVITDVPDVARRVLDAGP